MHLQLITGHKGHFDSYPDTVQYSYSGCDDIGYCCFSYGYFAYGYISYSYFRYSYISYSYFDYGDFGYFYFVAVDSDLSKTNLEKYEDTNSNSNTCSGLHFFGGGSGSSESVAVRFSPRV